MKKARWSRTSRNGSPRLFLLTAIEKAIAHNQRLQVKLFQASVEDDKDREWTDKDNLHEASEASYRQTFQASTLDKNTKVGEQQAIALKRLESLDRYIRHLQIRNAKQTTESNYENEDEQSAMNSNYTQYETKV